MSTTQRPTFFLSRAHPYLIPNAHGIQDALLRGKKASDKFKTNYQPRPKTKEHLITAGHYIEGVSQDFVLHSKNSVRYSSGPTCY
jgi:hypothetical protein